MKITIRSLRRAALIALSSSALVTLSVGQAYAGTELSPLADKKASALPVTTSFAKGTPGENGGPYALTVKNTSKTDLKVAATIVWSVASHNRAKTIDMPPHTIAAGESWTISDLAVQDRVILSAEGFEKLEVVTPPGKSEK